MNPITLLKTVFYLNGRMCLRGGREHETLKIVFDCDEGGDYVQYSDHGSKNRSEDKGDMSTT